MSLKAGEVEMTNEDAKELLNEWQIRLGLTDWRIKLSVNCEPHEMEMESVGCTSWQEVSKTAHIYIIDKKYYGDRVVPFDFEKTLVHELLHLKTCLLFDTGNELQDRIAHQLIDDLARAFVDVKEGR
jgi:hypothetical protein